jgi:dipeptidyl aminopeptidase/acylaminoacyl peptidase
MYMKNTAKYFGKLYGILLLLVAGTLPLYAQDTHTDKRVITAEDLWEMTRPGSPEVSPDGRTVAFTITEYDIEKNASETNIYLIPAAGGEMRRFTMGNSDSSPVWSPDGKTLAFTSRRHDGPAQLYIVSVEGGEARKITSLPVAVSAPKWFPDGKRIAFSASVDPAYESDFKKLETLIKERSESKVTAKVTENRTYRFWDRWLTDGMYPRLFSVDVETEDVTDLMPGSQRYFAMMGAPGYDISPDGTEIAVSANSSEPPYDFLNYDIWLLSTNGSGDIRNITADNPAGDTNPVYSPDGRYIMYGKQTSSHFYADNVRLVRFDRTTGEHRVLTENIDMSFSQWVWSEDGRTIFFLAEKDGAQPLFAIPSAGGDVRTVHTGGTNSSVSLAAGGTLVFTHTTFSNPPELYTIRRNGRDLKKLTSLNDKRLAELKFGIVENVIYEGADGADVQMYIVYPPDFDPEKKWPLVVKIHGGPHGIFGDSFHFRWNAHLFAAPGYVTILPNFHGSTSFGQAFAESIHGAHSEKPFIDIMKATDYMIGRGFIDENRMAATGGSYGGYMVSWIAGHTDRFAALVNHAGVYNIMGQFASDGTYHRVAAYSGAPWDGLESMQRWNPALHAENFKTPMLVIHGERDYRVPVTQGLEVYGVYKGKGLDARLVYFPNENHWILSPQNSVYWYKEVHDWLERYLVD